jgi:hypothetical protein
VSPELARTIRWARGRIAWQRTMHAASWAATGVVACGLGAQLLTSIFPFEVRAVWIYLTAGGVALVTLVAGRFLLRPGLYEAAHALDRLCGLHDLLCTALALSKEPVRPPLGEFVLAQAVRCARGLDVRQALPLRWRPDRRLIVLAALVLLWDLLLLGTTLPLTPARRVAETIRTEGRRLEQVATEAHRRARFKRAVRTLEAAEATREVAQSLQDTRTTRSVALARLGGLQERLERAHKAVQEALRARLGPTPELGSAEAVEESFRQWRALERGLGGVRTERELERIREALRALGEDPGSPPALQKAARQALRALARGDRRAAQETISQALTDLEAIKRLLAEEEGLHQVGHEVERAHQRIVSGTPGQAVEDREAAAGAGRVRMASPGERSPGEERPEGAVLSEGPDEGLEAGAGAARTKLGPPTDRLRTEHRREVLRGAPAEDQVVTAEIRGPGIRSAPRTAAQAVSPLVVRQVDDALARQRVPSAYREIVRRYFLELARRRE